MIHIRLTNIYICTLFDVDQLTINFVGDVVYQFAKLRKIKMNLTGSRFHLQRKCIREHLIARNSIRIEQHSGKGWKVEE